MGGVEREQRVQEGETFDLMSHLTSAWWGIPGHEVCWSDGTLGAHARFMLHRPGSIDAAMATSRVMRCQPMHDSPMHDPPARLDLGRLPGSLDTRVPQSACRRAPPLADAAHA